MFQTFWNANIGLFRLYQSQDKKVFDPEEKNDIIEKK